MNNINDLDISLLGFLSMKSMHGYDLHKQVANLTGFGIVWKVKIGKLYTMLNKLEKEGLIKSTFAKEGNRPVRNEFSITSSGTNIYNTWLTSPVNRGRDFRIIFLLKLYFSLINDILGAGKLISAQIETCNNWLSLREIREEDEIDLDGQNTFPVIVNKYRQIQIQGYLTWLKWCRETLFESM